MRFFSTLFPAVALAVVYLTPATLAQCPAQLAFNPSSVANKPGNPFQAESITSWQGAPTFFNSPLKPSTNFIARDSLGRVRVERSTGKYRIKTSPEAGTDAEQKTITICDPRTHEITVMDNLNKTARIFTIGARPGLLQNSGDANTSTFCELPAAYQRSSHFQIENLGNKSIDGFAVQGWRITNLGQLGGTNGTQQSMTSARDRWCSEELGAVLLETSSSAKPGIHHEVALTKIKLGEPDPSLFQIPSDYTVTERVPSRPVSPAAPQL
jgi:hypothetical protein